MTETVTQYTHWCQNKVSKLPVLSISCWLHFGLYCILNFTFSGRDISILWDLDSCSFQNVPKGWTRAISSWCGCWEFFYGQVGFPMFFLFLPSILFPRSYMFWQWRVVVWLLSWSKFTKGKEREPFATVFSVPPVRDVALNIWKKMEFGFMAFGRKTDIFHRSFRLVGTASTESCLGMKHGGTSSRISWYSPKEAPEPCSHGSRCTHI